MDGVNFPEIFCNLRALVYRPQASPQNTAIFGAYPQVERRSSAQPCTKHQVSTCEGLGGLGSTSQVLPATVSHSCLFFNISGAGVQACKPRIHPANKYSWMS